MTETLNLSRYKDKNPAAKVAVQTRQVKSKVEKASKKRRPESMVKLDPRYEQRLAELDHEVVMIQLENDEVRLSQARELERKAERYMTEHGTSDFAAAVRAVGQEGEMRLTNLEPSDAEVERYMREHDLSDYGKAVRAISTDRLHHEQAFGTPSTGGVSPEQDQAELRRIAEERGYGEV